MPPKDPLVGTRIREYEILDVIGKGGMGAVYRARHVYLDEERAIKVVHSEFASDEGFVQRFIREAKMLVKLRHRNLVQLYEFGTLGESVFFMVLELIRGEPLHERVHRNTKIPFAEAVKVIREAALGLHQAHQKGIVHRDISPDNLLIVKGEDGIEMTKVIDFGIAKPLEDQTRIFTRTNMFLGKPEFCSPEQCGALEEGEVIDHRSDIYSLGITFYYSLTGKLPFFSPTAHGYLLKHVNENPKPVATHFPPGAFPEALDKIILKALAKKRENRYASMDEFAKALDEFAGGSKPAKQKSGAASPAITDLPAGFLWERRYSIEKLLREGTNGVFYKAIDEIFKVPVVLKIISRENIQDEEDMRRFKRGVILAREVSHPNVCRIYDVGEADLGLYVSMAFVEGKLLSELLHEQKTVQTNDAFQIGKDLLSAVKEIHRLGIIHRNITPKSIIIDSANHAYIMDFGGYISETAAATTDPMQQAGTPLYMAPEQFSGHQIDHRADVYSVGAVLYEIFTGRLPFQAPSAAGLIQAYLNSEPVKPSSFVRGFSPDLEKVLLKAIDRNASARYQTAADLLMALESAEMAILEPRGKGDDLESTFGDPKQAPEKRFKELFEKGKELYDQLRLEDAIQAWKEALAINPNDNVVQKCVSSAESRLTKENQLKKELNALLIEGEKHLTSNRLDGLRDIIAQCEKLLTPSRRFLELRERVNALRKNLETQDKRARQ